MFTIRKIHGIYILFNMALAGKPINTALIDSLRSSESQSAANKADVLSKVEGITQLTPTSELERQVNTYFTPDTKKYKFINLFFKEHPHVFSDLIRVVHKFRLNNNEQDWHIPPEHMPSIQQIFLFQGRESKTGVKIPAFIELISEHKKFIAFCSGQKSLLDIGSHEFMLIPYKNLVRKQKIQELIIQGLVRNIDGCNSTNYEQFFKSRKDRILHYIKAIFGTNILGLEWCQTVEQFSSELDRFSRTGSGNDRKRIWKVIQGFYAWSDVVEIEERYADLLSKLPEVPKWLKKKCGINIVDVTSEKDPLGNTIYSGLWKYNTDTVIKVSWRAKRPRSTLQKKWEKEDYGHARSTRDDLGLSFTYPDDTSDDIKADIHIRTVPLMPRNGYILKKKGGLENEEIYKNMINDLKLKKKEPLFESSEQGGDPNMRNTSMSGFAFFEGRARGCELQFSTESIMKWKKIDDIKYKPKGLLHAIMRGSHQATPQELIDALPQWIDRKNLPIFDCASDNEVFIKMINDQLIIPYIYSEEGSRPIVLITTKTHEAEFRKKWSTEFRRYEGTSDIHHESLMRYIDSLKQSQ